MNISAKLPTWSEVAQMREDKDKISLLIVYIAGGLVILSLVLGILALFGYKQDWPVNIIDWLKTIGIICWPLAIIGIVILQHTRATFICKKREKDETRIDYKAREVKEAFKNWIIEKYLNINLREAQDHYLAHDSEGRIHDIKPKEIYETSEPVEIKFNDLEEVYPKNEADKQIDQKVRERVFDALEYSDKILKVEEKYRLYIFANTEIRHELFEKYNIRHWGINLKDL